MHVLLPEQISKKTPTSSAAPIKFIITKTVNSKGPQTSVSPVIAGKFILYSSVQMFPLFCLSVVTKPHFLNLVSCVRRTGPDTEFSSDAPKDHHALGASQHQYTKYPRQKDRHFTP